MLEFVNQIHFDLLNKIKLVLQNAKPEFFSKSGLLFALCSLLFD